MSLERSATLALVHVLFFAFAPAAGGGCGAPAPATGAGTPATPVVVAPVQTLASPSASASASATAPLPASRASEDAGLIVDGVKLGTPIGVLLARAPYDRPCDVDPVDHKRATLYFWAAGPCRQAPAFPGRTSLVIVTPRGADAPREQQPITLVAWAGGAYFDDKADLPIRIGDTAARALEVLGAPTATKHAIRFKDGQSSEERTLSWGRVHAFASGQAIVALAVGDLDITAEGELAETLERLHRHHQRYVMSAGP